MERAVLVGLVTRNQSEELLDEYLDELAFLTETAGAIPVKRFTQKLDRPDSKTFLGSGKLNQIVEYIVANEIDLLIFDDELSPSQLRNIEKEAKQPDPRYFRRSGSNIKCQNTSRISAIPIFASTFDENVDPLGTSKRRNWNARPR